MTEQLNLEKVSISERMRKVLDLSTDTTRAGNVAAHAVKTAYATSDDPFAGMEIGWADEDPAVLEYLVRIVQDVDDLFPSGEYDGPYEEGYGIASHVMEAIPTKASFVILSSLFQYHDTAVNEGDISQAVHSALHATAAVIADVLIHDMATNE